MVRKHSSAVYHGGVLGCRVRPHVESRETMTDPTPQLWWSRDRTPVATSGLLRRRGLVSLIVALGAAGCAASAASSGTGPSSAESAGHRSGVASTTATLAGARCSGGHCSCRRPGDTHAENPPPDADHKRFEIRLSNEDGGDAVLDSPTLGRFSAGGSETCFYVDVLPGTGHMVTFTAHEGRSTAGLSPTLRIAEYGPEGAVLVRRGRGALPRRGRPLHARRRRGVGRRGQGPQARPHRSLRLERRHPPRVGHLGRRRRPRQWALSRRPCPSRWK